MFAKLLELGRVITRIGLEAIDRQYPQATLWVNAIWDESHHELRQEDLPFYTVRVGALFHMPALPLHEGLVANVTTWHLSLAMHLATTAICCTKGTVD